MTRGPSKATQKARHHNVFWQRESLFPHNVNKEKKPLGSADVPFFASSTRVLFMSFASKEQVMILISGQTRRKEANIELSTIRTFSSGNN